MLLLSKSEGIGGAIKGSPDDFLVEEITQSGTVLEVGRRYGAADLGMQKDLVEKEKRFSVFALQKRNWNTSQALAMIGRKFSRGIKSMGFAGTKDRISVSTQLCSIYGVRPEKLQAVNIKDLQINGAWDGNAKINLGGLLGNRFTAVVRGTEKAENIDKVAAELHGVFPNYFGEQRFGFRNNNVEIGLDIIRGNFQEAAMRFLTDTTNEKNADAIEARNRLAGDVDFEKALGYFPEYLKYERSLLDRLSVDPDNYAAALRRLPRNLLLMFVHSVDSYIFNAEVEMRIKNGETEPHGNDVVCGSDGRGFPNMESAKKLSEADKNSKHHLIVGNIVGHENEINDTEMEILKNLGIEQQQFRVSGMPELVCKGSRRVLFAPYVGFSWEKLDDRAASMRFSLPAGSYATVLLDEFIKQHS